MAEGNKLFNIEIITPERVFFEGKGSMIEMNTTEGEIGCYPMHVPTTVVLSPGIVTIHDAQVAGGLEIPEPIRNDGSLMAAIHAGFAEILGTKVVLMAEIAEWPSEIDRSRAEAAQKRAEGRIEAKTEEMDIMRAENSLRKALVRQKITSLGG
ncbi:MAG: ATP synthase F1 subunit epsilon [Lachnospiraceae bacterium]|nr:ATP synthase F1 subunit epsilon [Lachnospiraceae bacterium]